MRKFFARYKMYIISGACLVIAIAIYMGSCSGSMGPGMDINTASNNSGQPTDSNANSPAVEATVAEGDIPVATEDPGVDLTPEAKAGGKAGITPPDDGTVIENPNLSQEELAKLYAADEAGRNSDAGKTTSAVSVKGWYDDTDTSYWYETVKANAWLNFSRYHSRGTGAFLLSTAKYHTWTHSFIISPYGDNELDYIVSSAIPVPPGPTKSVILQFSTRYDLESDSMGAKYLDYVNVQVDPGTGSFKNVKVLGGRSPNWPYWTKWSIPLPRNTSTASRNYKIRFVFISDTTNHQNWGFAVDELRVFWDHASDGAAIVPIAAWSGSGGPTAPPISQPTMTLAQVQAQEALPENHLPVPIFYMIDGNGNVCNSGPPQTKIWLKATDSYDPDHGTGNGAGIKYYFWKIAGNSWVHTTEPIYGPCDSRDTYWVLLKVENDEGMEAIGEYKCFTVTPNPPPPPPAYPGADPDTPGVEPWQKNIDWAWSNNDSFGTGWLPWNWVEYCGTVEIPTDPPLKIPVGYVRGMTHHECVQFSVAAYYYEQLHPGNPDCANMALKFLECSQKHNDDARATIHAQGYAAVNYAVARYGPLQSPTEYIKTYMKFGTGIYSGYEFVRSF